MARYFAKTLPCRLTDKEVNNRTQDLLILMKEIETEKDAEKERRKEWKDEQDQRKKRIDELRDQIHGRIENRAVKCEEKRNDVTKTMETIRLDDKSAWPDLGAEVVNSRPLSPAELQIELISDHQRGREGEGLEGVEGVGGEVDPFEGTEDEDEDAPDAKAEEPAEAAAAPAEEKPKAASSKRGK